MRIDPKYGIDGIYESNLKKNTSVDKEENKENEYGKDRIEISKDAGSFGELDAVKQKIVNDVEKGTSPDRLRKLKEQIQNGTYRIDSRELADAILNFNRTNTKDGSDE